MWLTWRAATQRALYGENGFYLRERPSAHFRTSVSATTGATVGTPAVLAGAVLRELTELTGPGGLTGTLDLVDVGAG
ncbi:hypothetical protein ACFQ08_45695, partial [Streptosporangium algeriense]